MDLPLDMDVPAGRRLKEPLVADFGRELDGADLALLEATGGAMKAQPIKRLSSRHHSLARLLAAGMPPGEAAIVAGYSASRISILQADPTFQELLTFYRKEVDAVFEDMHERLVGLSTDALELLRERLEEEPESISVAQLLEVAKMGTDRTGYGPQTKSEHQHNHTVNIADRLESARERIAQRRSREAEDAEVIPNADD